MFVFSSKKSVKNILQQNESSSNLARGCFQLKAYSFCLTIDNLSAAFARDEAPVNYIFLWKH